MKQDPTTQEFSDLETELIRLSKHAIKCVQKFIDSAELTDQQKILFFDCLEKTSLAQNCWSRILDRQLCFCYSKPNLSDISERSLEKIIAETGLPLIHAEAGYMVDIAWSIQAAMNKMPSRCEAAGRPQENG